MSLSLGKALRVGLCLDHLQLLQMTRELSLSGISSRVLEKKLIPCLGATQSGSALQTLEAALSALPEKPGSASVILSNQFLRYAVIPWSDSLSGEAEQQVYAKHYFGQLYGVPAETWELRLFQEHPGAALFVSAIEKSLLQGLRELFAAHKVKLASVQPYLVAAYNHCHASLQHQQGWLVFFEAGSLCLGYVVDGHWRGIRSLKVGNLDKLSEILDRESYLCEYDAPSAEVYVWAPEYRIETMNKSVRWKIHRLEMQAGPDYEARFAMALCG